MLSYTADPGGFHTPMAPSVTPSPRPQPIRELDQWALTRSLPRCEVDGWALTHSLPRCECLSPGCCLSGEAPGPSTGQTRGEQGRMAVGLGSD